MTIRLNSCSFRMMLFIYFALIAAAALAPLSNNHAIPNQADLYNHIAAIIHAAKEMTQQFPLRVANLRNDGIMYPFFQFYVPTSYVYAGLIYKYLVPSNPYIAYKITIWSALLFAGIYTYRIIFQFTKSRPASVLAGTVFITAPYLNVLVGALGAFNELIAISIIPFIFFYTLRDYENPSKLKYLLLVSAGWYLLITIHIITFIYAALLIGILFLLLTFKIKQWKHLIRVGIAIAFGCALATWFLVPEIIFSHYFSVRDSFPTAESIYEASANLPSILSPMLSKILNMQQNVVTRAHTSLGIPILVGVGLAVYAWMTHPKKQPLNIYLLPLLVIFFISFLLLWSPVNIWQYLPKSLLVIQYTMRMLGQLVWIGALIVGLSLCWLFDGVLDKRHAAVGIVLIFAATSSLLPTLADGSYTINGIVKKPIILFNPDAYIIDPLKSSELVSQIDNYILDTLYVNGKLKLDNTFNLPMSLLTLAKQPSIVLDGYFLNKHSNNHYILQVLVNGQVVGQLNLQKTTPITWNIPLNLASLKKTQAIMPVQFHLKTSDKQAQKEISDITIQADKIALTGFMMKNEVKLLNQANAACHLSGDQLSCRLTAPPKGLSVLELPLFYYPKLFKITLNGKTIPYQGILYNGKLLVGIAPIASVDNNIKAQFVGLSWANIASLISWSLWGMILIYYLYGLRRRAD